MNVDELQSVQSRERQTDQLQQLRATFYEEAGQFVAQLREERERAAARADDPFDSPEVNHLTDDINTAEKTIEAIYERRVGKIVKMASLAAADMPTEEDGLTREERELFETMVEAIKRNRNHVLDVVSGETSTDSDEVVDGSADVGTPVDQSAESSTTPDPAPDPQSEQSDSGVGAADVMGGTADERSPPPMPEELREQDPATQDPPTQDSAAQDPPARDPAANAESDDGIDRPADEAVVATGSDPSPSPSSGDASTRGAPTDDESSRGAQTDGGAAATDVTRRTVRITDDVGEIFGVDEREYDLSTDDVVTLPRDNADPLIEQDAAEPLE